MLPLLDRYFIKTQLDKNGCRVNENYEGNVTDINDKQMSTGIWHRFVTTKEENMSGGTITRKYLDGKLVEFDINNPSPMGFP